jgi:Na+-driven multidrug efflux pump
LLLLRRCSIAGFSVLIGMLGAQDTCCGQAYGAENYKNIGKCFMAQCMMGTCAEPTLRICSVLLAGDSSIRSGFDPMHGCTEHQFPEYL